LLHQLVEYISQLVGEIRREFARRTVDADDDDRRLMADDLDCQRLELRVIADVDDRALDSVAVNDGHASTMSLSR